MMENKILLTCTKKEMWIPVTRICMKTSASFGTINLLQAVIKTLYILFTRSQRDRTKLGYKIHKVSCLWKHTTNNLIPCMCMTIIFYSLSVVWKHFFKHWKLVGIAFTVAKLALIVFKK